jgi:excinuclease UvrABC nuclease subunit
MRLDQMLPHHVELAAPPALLDPRQLPAHGAVYALSDSEDRFIQLAAAENLRRAISTRLKSPEADQRGRRADLRAITRHVRYIGTYSQFETMYRFHRCARDLMPADYLDQIAFGPAWFAHVNPLDVLPRWICTSSPFAKDGPAIGPFVSRSVCTQLIELLEDLFDLCRHYDILQQTPNGQACAYFEMGKCPAPCDGSIPLDRYRQMVSDSIVFAAGDSQPFRSRVADRMREAAGQLEFERAATLKQTLERADRIGMKAYRFARPAEQFNFLIVQRAGGRSRVKPFYVRRGHISEGEVVTAKELQEAVPEWIRRASGHDLPSDDVDPTCRAEEAWLVSHFLFKQDKVPGLYLVADRLPEPVELADLIQRAFKLGRSGKTPDSDSTADPTPEDSTLPEHSREAAEESP